MKKQIIGLLILVMMICACTAYAEEPKIDPNAGDKIVVDTTKPPIIKRPNVVLPGWAGFTIPANKLDGETFVTVPFVQTGAGVLTATLDGEPLVPVDGAFAIPAMRATENLVFSFAGEGCADFTKMRRNAGVLLLVR